MVAGLFGKLPAHGDFVRRGWPDDVVDAIDDWLTTGIAEMRRSHDDDDFAERMHAAPLWQGYVPPGLLGSLALHVGVAPSVDRAGRLFPIAAGVAGDAAAAWCHAGSGFGAVLDGAIYDALAGRGDADALIDALEASAVEDADRAAPGAGSAWWRGPPAGAPAIASAVVDAALFRRLLCEEPA